jgi:arylsulfatase A-like enzyme
MKRRAFIHQTGLASLCTAAVSAGSTSPQPNVVILFADDLGYGDVGFNGSTETPTPHIDSIAQNGVVCANGYSSCAVCGPSRAGLLSGRYQNRLGFEDNPGPFRQSKDTKLGFPLEQKTIADRLKALGYATGMIGKQHDGIAPEYNPIHRGFDEFYGFNNGASSYFEPNKLVRGLEPATMQEKYMTDDFGREAVEFIQRHKNKPFFLYMAFNAPHGPMQARADHLEKFRHIKDEKRRACVAMICSMDENIGRILSELRKNKLEENTLIFFLSDNGGGDNTSSNGPLHGQKGELFDGGIHVPFAVQWKSNLPAGTTFVHPVISLDLLPTAVAAAGGKISSDWKLDGVDLLPHLTGISDEPPHDALYWRFLFQHAIRSKGWKLVKPKGGDAELYNIANDPNEIHNVIREFPEVAERLQKKFDAWASELPPPQWGWQPAYCGKIRIDPKNPDKDW